MVVVGSAFAVSRFGTTGYEKMCKSAVTVWVGYGYGVDTVRVLWDPLARPAPWHSQTKSLRFQPRKNVKESDMHYPRYYAYRPAFLIEVQAEAG